MYEALSAASVSSSGQPFLATSPTRIAFAAAPTTLATQSQQRLVDLYGNQPLDRAEVIVCLGGDGFLLETLHRLLDTGSHTPVYGMNCGSVGFLMNAYAEDGLIERLSNSQGAILHPLRMRAETGDGKFQEALALNEVSLLRQMRQTAKDKNFDRWSGSSKRVDLRRHPRFDACWVDGI